jgi:hypothetical protein
MDEREKAKKCDDISNQATPGHQDDKEAAKHDLTTKHQEDKGATEHKLTTEHQKDKATAEEYRFIKDKIQACRKRKSEIGMSISRVEERMKPLRQEQRVLRKEEARIDAEERGWCKKRRLNPIGAAERAAETKKERDARIRDILWCAADDHIRELDDLDQRQKILDDCLQNISDLSEHSVEQEDSAGYGATTRSTKYTLKYTYKADKWLATARMDDFSISCLTDQRKDEHWSKTCEPGAMLAHFWTQRHDPCDGPLEHQCACGVALDCSDTF